MNHLINTTYPRKFICVQTASYPEHRLDYNEQALQIRKEVDKRYNVKRNNGKTR